LKTKISLHTVVILLIAGVLIALDQYTKQLARAYLPLNTSWNPIAWLDRFVTLTFVHNTGIAFGLFQGASPLFILPPFIVVGIVIYYRKLAAESWLLTVAFGLLMAGATGNVIDRIVRGYVTDFVDVRIWPIFNVADSSVVVGTILLACYALFFDRPSSAPDAATTTNGSQ
jgi:signal peptidase II